MSVLPGEGVRDMTGSCHASSVVVPACMTLDVIGQLIMPALERIHVAIRQGVGEGAVLVEGFALGTHKSAHHAPALGPLVTLPQAPVHAGDGCAWSWMSRGVTTASDSTISCAGRSRVTGAWYGCYEGG